MRVFPPCEGEEDAAKEEDSGLHEHDARSLGQMLAWVKATRASVRVEVSWLALKGQPRWERMSRGGRPVAFFVVHQDDVEILPEEVRQLVKEQKR